MVTSAQHIWFYPSKLKLEVYFYIKFLVHAPVKEWLWTLQFYFGGHCSNDILNKHVKSEKHDASLFVTTVHKFRYQHFLNPCKGFDFNIKAKHDQNNYVFLLNLTPQSTCSSAQRLVYFTLHYNSLQPSLLGYGRWTNLVGLVIVCYHHWFVLFYLLLLCHHRFDGRTNT